MSNIVKREELNLSISETKLFSALSKPMIKDISNQGKDAATVALIGGLFANVNERNPDKAVLIKMKSDLRELMDSEFKAMRVEEIKIALDWGSDNWEGHGVSSKLIKNWIRTWRTTKKLEIQKSIAIKKKNIPSPPPKELTTKEKIYSINHEFDNFCKGEKIRVKIYNYLVEFGFIVTNVMKYCAVDIAIPKLKREAKDFKMDSTTVDLETRKGINEMKEHHSKIRIQELIECNPNKPIPIVTSEAQRILIYNFFNNCLQECNSLSDYLTVPKTKIYE